MSKEVDQRVVEMRFDNREFESNARTTMNTLKSLKDSLNFNGAVKGLEELDRVGDQVDLSGLSSSINSIKVQFSAMQIAGIAALTSIANQAVATGSSILNSLTLEPIMSGFQEYETQINAVQTILANTSKDGTTLEQVSAALDELNRYADQTIYNFTEMTRNIGTFTAAGVDLDTSVQAIKGIANLAALSGSNAQQASSAMYQLSQALAAGRVTLQDWNSVVNAGMGGKIFQDALMDTAEAMGIVVDRTKSFRETISATGGQDSWLTSEVLLNTLKQFTGDLTDAELAAIGFNKEQIKSIQSLAVTANDAATKVKTLTQLFDTLKESVQSGWTSTWELVIGDFEEAKIFFTDVSNLFGEFFQKSADARNVLVEEVMSSSWDQLSKKIQDAGLDLIDFQDRAWELGKQYGVVTDELMENAGSFEATLKNGWLNADIFSQVLSEFGSSGRNAARDTAFFTKKLESFQKVVKDIWDGDYATQTERINALSEAGYEYSEVEELVSKTIKGTTISVDDLTYAQQKAVGFTEEQTKALYDLANQARDSESYVGSLVETLSKESGRELLLGSFYNILKAIMTLIDTVGSAWGEVFKIDPRSIYNALNSLHNFTEGLILSSESANNLKRTLKGIFSIFDIFTTIVKNSVSTVATALGELFGIVDVDFLSMTAQIGDELVKFRESLDLDTPFEKLNAHIKEVIDTLKEFKLPDLSKYGVSLDALTDGFKSVTESIKEFIGSGLNNLGIDSLYDIFNIGAVGGIAAGLYTLSKKLKSPLKTIEEAFGTKDSVISSIKDSFEAVKESLEGFQNSIQANTIMTIAKAIGLLAVSLFAIALIDSERVTKSLGAISVMLVQLLTAFWTIQELNSINGLKSSIGLASVTAFLISLSTSLLVLSAAIKVLSTVDVAGLAKGLTGVGVLLAEISVFMSYTNMGGFGVFKGIGLIALAGALTILAHAVKVFESISVGTLLKGLFTLGSILMEIGLFFNGMIDIKRVVSTSVGLTILGGALMIISKAVESMGNLTWDQVIKGLFGIGVSLLGIGGALRIFPKNTISLSAGLVILGGALQIITSAVERMGSMSFEQIGKSMLTLAVSMSAIALALNLMNGTMSGSTSLLIASAAITVLGSALEKLGNMTIKQAITSLGVLAAALTTVGIAGAVLGPLAPSILAVAASISLLGVGIFAVGAGIAAFSAGIVTLATSVATGGAAIVTAVGAIGAGIAISIPKIASAIAQGIIDFAQTIINGASTLAEAGRVLIETLANAIISTAPMIAEGAVTLFVSFLEIVETYSTPIIESVVGILINLINALAVETPKLVQAAIDLAVAFINGFADGIRENAHVIFAAIRNLFSSIIELLLTAIQELVRGIPFIGDELENALENLKTTVRETLAPESMQPYGEGAVNGVNAGIQNGSTTLQATAYGIGTLLKQGLEAGGAGTYNVGLSQGTSYANGLSQSSYAAQAAGYSLASSSSSAISGSSSEFEAAGNTLGNSFATGLSQYSTEATTAGTSLKTASLTGMLQFAYEYASAGSTLGTTYATSFQNTSDDANLAGKTVSASGASGAESNVWRFQNAGDKAGQGFYNGIMAWASRAAEAAREMVRSAVEAAEEELDSHSPSRRFMELGENTDEGYIIGIKNLIPKVREAGGTIGKEALTSMKESINRISEAMDDSIDPSPRITPIIDMSEMDKGFKKIDASFSSRRALSINSSMEKKRDSNRNGMNPESKESVTWSFTQNNYSPKALSRLEIYRQTKNQFAMAKGLVSKK